MCGGGGVQDNSDKVAAIEAQRAREERLAAEAKAKEERDRFTSALNGAYNTAINDAQAYFASMGLDPSQYAAPIAAMANSFKSSVPDLDKSPGTYFSDLGKSVYDREQTALRSKGIRDVNSFAKDGFDLNLIRDTADDPFVDALISSNFNDASRSLEGQVARGTLTDFGLQQAMKDLTRQKGTARSTLEGLTSALLETERGKLRNIASSGRTAANSLNLGDVFDPFSYQRNMNDEVSSFFNALGDKVNSVAPTDLFDVATAFQYGGQRQGLTNSGYDSDASSGILNFFADQEEAKKKKAASEAVF